MNELQIFRNSEFGEIRTVTNKGDPLFCLADICRILELSTPSKVKERLNEKGVSSIPTLTPGGIQDITFITESNLYKVIFQSRKSEAEKFSDWVTSEVLPSIRKNGGYISGQETMTDDELMAKALLVAQNKIAERDALIKKKDEHIAIMQPKAEFFDAVAESKSAVSMNEVAKVLDVRGYGRNKLFQFLRDKKVLDQWNKPYQRYVDSGWFRLIEQHYSKNGEECINFKTLVYQKGIDQIRKMLSEV